MDALKELPSAAILDSAHDQRLIPSHIGLQNNLTRGEGGQAIPAASWWGFYSLFECSGEQRWKGFMWEVFYREARTKLPRRRVLNIMYFSILLPFRGDLFRVWWFCFFFCFLGEKAKMKFPV